MRIFQFHTVYRTNCWIYLAGDGAGAESKCTERTHKTEEKNYRTIIVSGAVRMIITAGHKAKSIRKKVKFGCAVRSSKKVKKIGPFYSSYTEVIRAGYNFIVSEFASYPQLIFHR